MDAHPDRRRLLRLAMDAAMVAAELLLFGLLASRWESLTAKLILPAYLLYCAGLFAKGADPAYLDGLSWFSRAGLFWIVSFCALQTVLGALALGSLTEIVGGRGGRQTAAIVAGLILVFPLALAAMIRLLRLAARPPAAVPPGSGRRRLLGRLTADAGVWAMGLVLMAFFHHLGSASAFPFRAGAAGMAGALLLAFLLGLLFYFPARFHYILEARRDPANWIGFFSAILLFALFLVRRR